MTTVAVHDVPDADPGCSDLAALAVTLNVWFVAAVVLAAGGAWLEAPRGPGVMILVALAAALAATRAVPALRRAVASVGVRPLILLHTVRVFATLFLVYGGAGLRPAWAIPAFWGDILVAATAIPVALLATPITTPARWRLVMAWNVVGIIDIVLAPAAAVTLVLLDPGSMSALQALPVVLAPTFFVPLVMFGHVVLTRRLLRDRAARRAAGGAA